MIHLKKITSFILAFMMVCGMSVNVFAQELPEYEKDGLKYVIIAEHCFMVMLPDCPKSPTANHMISSLDNIREDAIRMCEIHHNRPKEILERDGVRYRENEYRNGWEAFLPNCPKGPEEIHGIPRTYNIKAEAEWYCLTHHYETLVEKNNSNYTQPEIEWEESGIKMAVNGETVEFPDQKPMLDAQAGRTYIPIRFLAEALGAEVDWDQEHQVVKIVNKYIEGENTKNVYYLKIGSNKIVQARYDNGGNIATSAAVFYMPESIKPVLEGGRTVIPFRYIAELLGAQVYYDPTTGTANCVKRDLSQYKKDLYAGAVPVLNSLIGEYFVDELNKYRTSYGYAPVTWNGDYSDMMTWAAFDQMTHPGQWEYYQKHHPGMELHLFSWNRNTDVNSRFKTWEFETEEERKYKVWHTGAYYQYVKTYLPDHPIYAKEMNVNHWGPEVAGQLEYWSSYGENAFVSHPIMSHFVQNFDLSAELYTELTKYWGLKIKKLTNETFDENLNLVPGPKNGEHMNIVVYSEASYRSMAKHAITVWSYSSGHQAVMLDRFAKEVGFATVGQYTYMCTMAH